MKKHLMLVLALTMCLTLTSCKSEAAKSVDNLISAIGEVTLDSESKIIEAENAVAALEEKDRKQIDKEKVLLDARAQYEDLVKDKEAQEVADAVSAIGTVTLDSEKSINAARKLYDSKAADIQERVSNYSELEAAEEKLKDLKAAEIIKLIDKIGTVTLDSEKSVSAARKLYNSANAEIQNLVTNYSKLEHAEDTLNGLKAAEVSALINAIGTVTLASEEKINTANSAYITLSDSAKNKVDNLDTLTAAKTELASLKAQAKEKEKNDAIAKLNSNTDKVEGITWYHSKTEPKYINTRCYIFPYIGQTSSRTWLRVQCNYTGDNWVFFEKIVFVVDGERYTKTFSYYEIVRDNDHGDVWEVADFGPTNSDIQMLKDIANSTETIVRFQGDNYHHDFTIGAKDKQAIRDVITAYEFMKG